jgi:hypothetical protein
MSRWLKTAADKIYMAPHHRRQHSLQSPPWKPQILHTMSNFRCCGYRIWLYNMQ